MELYLCLKGIGKQKQYISKGLYNLKIVCYLKQELVVIVRK